MVKCPFCDKNMNMMQGLPPYLDLVKIAKDHPNPLIRNFAVRRAADFQQTIEKHVYYYKCLKLSSR